MSLLRVSPRLEGRHELLDDPHADSGALERSLADLRLVNRMLGFTRGVVGDVWPLVLEAGARAGAPAVVLDAGTGSGDIALALARRAGRDRIPLVVVGLDSHDAVLHAAARHVAAAPPAISRAVRLVRGDARRLPLADRAVDVALASLLVHHLSAGDAVALLAELARVARVGVVASDLVRHPLALLGIRALTRLGPFHPMTRHDGPLSVQRAYTPEELTRLASHAGLDRGGRLVRHPFWRMAWIWRRPGAASAERRAAAAPGAAATERPAAGGSGTVNGARG